MPKEFIKVVPISARRGITAEIADLAFDWWRFKGFERGGSPEQVLVEAALEITRRNGRGQHPLSAADPGCYYPVTITDSNSGMDLPGVIAELRFELEQIDRAIRSLERLAGAQPVKRARRPAAIAAANGNVRED
jgi:hypothetical protein